MKRKTLYFVPLLLAFGLVTGCGSSQDTAVKQAATNYAQESMSGNWKATMQDSTGEELGILSMLSNELSASNFKSNVRLVEVLKVDVQGSDATALVHIVRDMNVPNFGTTTDDRQVLYHLYNVNGQWKVYRVDMVLQNS